MAEKTPEMNTKPYDERQELKRKLDAMIDLAGKQAWELKQLRNQLKAEVDGLC